MIELSYLVWSVFLLASACVIHWAARKTRQRQGILPDPCFLCGGGLVYQPAVETRREVVDREDGRPGQVEVVYGLGDAYECRRCHARFRYDTPSPGVRRLVAAPKREPEIELRRESVRAASGVAEAAGE